MVEIYRRFTNTILFLIYARFLTAGSSHFKDLQGGVFPKNRLCEYINRFFIRGGLNDKS
jgi:hypothetical protein